MLTSVSTCVQLEEQPRRHTHRPPHSDRLTVSAFSTPPPTRVALSSIQSTASGVQHPLGGMMHRRRSSQHIATVSAPSANEKSPSELQFSPTVPASSIGHRAKNSTQAKYLPSVPLSSLAMLSSPTSLKKHPRRRERAAAPPVEPAAEPEASASAQPARKGSRWNEDSSSAGSSAEDVEVRDFAVAVDADLSPPNEPVERGANTSFRHLSSPMFDDSPSLSVQAHSEFDWQQSMSPLQLAFEIGSGAVPPATASSSSLSSTSGLPWLDDTSHAPWSPFVPSPAMYDVPTSRPISPQPEASLTRHTTTRSMLMDDAEVSRTTRAILDTQQPSVDLAAYFDKAESEDRRKRRRMQLMVSERQVEMELESDSNRLLSGETASLHRPHLSAFTSRVDSRDRDTSVYARRTSESTLGFPSYFASTLSGRPPSSSSSSSSMQLACPPRATTAPPQVIPAATITSIAGSGGGSAASSPSPITTLSVPSNYLRTESERLDTQAISSIIRQLYGLSDEEMGHRTYGHSCVSKEEVALAANGSHDLLYGEVLPVGATRLFDRLHLDLKSARTLCDLGSGLGKLAIQAFLQWPNLTRVTGCELSQSRFQKSSDALRRLWETRQQWRRHRKARMTEEDQEERRRRLEEEEEEEQKSNTATSSASSLPLLPRLHFQTSSTVEERTVSTRFSESLSHVPQKQTRSSDGAGAGGGSKQSRLLRELGGGSSSSANGGMLIDQEWMSVREYEQFLTRQHAEERRESQLSDNSDDVEMKAACASEAPHSKSGSFSSSPSCSAFSISPTRTLELRCLNLFDMTEAFQADVVICETKFQEENYLALCQLVNKFKKGCRLLTYENLDVVFTKVYGEILSESAQQQHTQATQQDASTSAASGTVDIDEDDDPIDEDLSVDPDPPLSGKVVQHISKHGAARSTATGRGEQRGEQSGSSSSRLSKLSAPSVLPSPPILPAIAQPARVGGAGGGTGGGRESKRKRTSPSLQAMRKSSAAQQQAPSAVEFDVETTSSTSSLSSLAVANSRASAARPAAAGAPASSTRGSSPTPCARHPYNPFRQYPINLSKSDRFFTSWATNLGHRFFLWEKVGPSARFCPVDQ